MLEYQGNANNIKENSGLSFTYSLPTIGSVIINLNGYPLIFYKVMEREGEIDRLKNLEHLGVLQTVFSGIRHTRWDYTVTMLYLVQRLWEAKVEGLSSAKKIEGVELSGRDMMQLLALAANIGHLPGTFTIEKGLMRFLAQNNEVVNELLHLADLPHNKFNQIDYINLNKMLVLVKLQWWLEDTDDQDKDLLKAIKTLVNECFIAKPEPESEHRNKIIDYFHLVRRVSYQLLDCLYVNLPLRIDYSEFTNQLHLLTFRKEELKTITELIDQYTRIVYKQIYHSDKARKVVALCSAEVPGLLDKSRNTLATIREWLNNYQMDDICTVISNYDAQRVVSISLPHGFWFNFLTESFREKRVEELEVNLANLISPAKPVILYIPGLKEPLLETTTSGDLLLDVYLEKVQHKDVLLKTLGLMLLWIHREFTGSLGIGKMVKAVVKNILALLTSDFSKIELSIDPTSDEFFRDDNIVPEDKIKIFRANKREVALSLFNREKKAWDSTTKQRFNECKTLREVIKRKWMQPFKGEARYHVIIPGRIKFHNSETRTDICEFDGAFLTLIVRRKQVLQLILYLVEAKKGKRTGETSAEREIRKKLNKLGLSETNIKTIRRKNAYAEIRLL
jgi:hypothetical protein